MSTVISTDFSDQPLFSGGKGLRHIQTSNGRRALSWDTPGSSISDVEIVAAVSFSAMASEERFAVILRGGGTSGNEDGYTFQIRQGLGIHLRYYDGGSTDEITNAGPDPIAGTRYLMRVRAEGTALKGKFWQRGTPEPEGWLIEETDSRLSSGWVGLWSFVGTGDAKYCDYFAVHSGTGSAPLPGETPSGSDDATDFSGQTVAAAPAGWTEEWATSNSTWTIQDSATRILPLNWVRKWNTTGGFGLEESGSAEGGKWLRQYTPGDAARKWIQWTDIADAADVLVEGTFKANPGLHGAPREFGVVLVRASGIESAATGYALVFRASVTGGNYTVGVRKSLDGVTTLPWTSGAGVWAVNVMSRYKFEATGTTIRVKVWDDGDTEPGSWLISETDEDISSGGVGVYSGDGSTANNQNFWDTFDVEYSGAADAPLAPALSVAFVGDTAVALETDPFQGVEDGEEHDSTRWNLTTAADTGFASPIWNAVSSVDLLGRVLDELDPETDYIARAFHRGVIGGESPASNVVEFTTAAAVPLPDTPTVTVEDKGTDFVSALRTAFAHSEGVGDGNPDEDGEILPYEVAGQWQVRQTTESWDEASIDTGLTSAYVRVLEALFGDLSAATNYEIRFRTQDGKHGSTSLWSTAVAFATDAVPEVRPATPTLTVDACGWPETEVSSSAFDHPEGGATHQGSRWWAGRMQSDNVVRYTSIITEDPSELLAFVWRQLEEGTSYLAVSHQDDSDRWSLRSDAVTCLVREPPDAPILTSHAPGAVIGGDTLFEWRMFEGEGWQYSGEISTDNGMTWAPLFGPQSGAEHLLSITGRPNGFYVLRVRACYPDAPVSCSDWLVVPFRIDRTGVTSIDYRFAGMEELPVTWVPIWDPTGAVSWTLVDADLQPIDQTGAGPAIGIRARHGDYLTQREGILAFTELGEPTELDITVSFAILKNTQVWHGWRFSQGRYTAAGAAYRAVDASETPDGQGKAGYATRVRGGGQAWQYGPCTSDSVALTEDAARTRPRVAANNPDRLFRFGVSGGGADMQMRGYREQGSSHWLFSQSDIETLGDLSRGLAWSKPLPEEEVCRYRMVSYAVRKWVTVEPNGFYRLRVQVYGPGVDTTQGPQIDRLIDPDQGLSFAPSWSFRDALCGYCGLYYWQLPSLTNDPGVVFFSASATLPTEFAVSGPIYGTPTVEITP